MGSVNLRRSGRRLALTTLLAFSLVTALGLLTPSYAQEKPSIETIIANLDARFAGVRDISGIIDLDQVSGDGSVVQAQATVQARIPNLLRLQFTRPETFAGSIYVLDRKANQLVQYSPITEQAIITGIDQALSDRFVPTTVEQLFSLPSAEDYDLQVIGTEQMGKVNLVSVSAKAKSLGLDDPSFQFWIDQNQWLVSKMQVFDAKGKLLFTIGLRDITLDRNLSDAQLKKMPAGTISVYR